MENSDVSDSFGTVELNWKVSTKYKKKNSCCNNKDKTERVCIVEFIFIAY